MTVFARFGISEMVCPSSWSVCGNDLIRAAFYNGLCTRSIFYRVSREAGVATLFAMTRLASLPSFGRPATPVIASAARQSRYSDLSAAWIATSLRSSQ